MNICKVKHLCLSNPSLKRNPHTQTSAFLGTSTAVYHIVPLYQISFNAFYTLFSRRKFNQSSLNLSLVITRASCEFNHPHTDGLNRRVPRKKGWKKRKKTDTLAGVLTNSICSADLERPPWTGACQQEQTAERGNSDKAVSGTLRGEIKSPLSAGFLSNSCQRHRFQLGWF